jgi:hypothetical protein
VFDCTLVLRGKPIKTCSPFDKPKTFAKLQDLLDVEVCQNWSSNINFCFADAVNSRDNTSSPVYFLPLVYTRASEDESDDSDDSDEVWKLIALLVVRTGGS